MIKRILTAIWLSSMLVFGQLTGAPQSNLNPSYAVDTGSVNALTAPLSPCPQSLAATKGLAIRVLPANANTTTTPTLTVCNFAATTITKFGQAALVANDLITTAIATLVYDGTDFELQNPGTATVGSIANITAVTANANVTTAQQLMELSLPAGYLNTAKLATVIHSSGIFSVTLTPTVTLTVKLCTVSGCGSGTVVNLAVFTSAATVTASNNQAMLNLFCGTTVTGASGTLICHGGSFVDLTSASVTAGVYTDANTAVSSTINLTGALFLDTFVTFSSASASNTMTDQLMYIGTPGGAGATGGGGGSGAPGAWTYLAKSANYTTSCSDFGSSTTVAPTVVDYTVSSATTVTHTLPNTVCSAGQQQYIKNDNASGWGMYVKPANSLTLDGDTTQIFLPVGVTLTLWSNGTNWQSNLGQMNTANKGGTYIPPVVNPAFGAFVLSAANTVQTKTFYLREPTKVSNITFTCSVGLAASTGDVGIADQGGNLVTHISGGVATTTANCAPTALKNAVSTVITLAPGLYTLAFCDSDVTTVKFFGETENNTYNTMASGAGTILGIGTSATACSAGVLPATLGAITISNTPNIAVIAVLSP